MLSVKYYLISPQQAYNILLACFCIIKLQHIRRPSSASVRKKKTKLKIKNLRFIMCISFNKVSPAQLIYHKSRYT